MACRRVVRIDAGRCPDDGGATELVAQLPKDALLGAYRINRMLGEGGMGFVYEATHSVLERRTAIKMLRPELASHEQIVKRFLNEARAVNLIDHQNIVAVYDYGDSIFGSVYFVMEFLEGETLDDLMRKRRPMAPALLVHVFGQIARALAAAHAKQIVHRDLKPANVYVIAREGNPYFVKLLDFGIAQLRGVGAIQGLTMAGSVMGTPQYMSPEQITGGTVDARSDVWALGVMMYRAATGQAPFQGEELGELADKILHHPPPPAETLVAMPAALAALIASCLERRIEARCASVADVLTGLARVQRELGLDDDGVIDAVRADAGALREGLPARRKEPTRDSIAGSLPRYQGAANLAVPAPARRTRRSFVIGALALCAVGVGGFAYTRQRHEVIVTPSPPPTIKDFIARGDREGAAKLAMAKLSAKMHGTLQEQGFAVDAIERAHATAGAPLLYIALAGADPDVRRKAAHALAELAIREAAPKLRSKLATLGDGQKLDLAIPLLRLGDADARTMVVGGLADPPHRLDAALALADVHAADGRAVLDDVIATRPVGSEQWLRATAALVVLGSTEAQEKLTAERAQSNPNRAVAACLALARAGDRDAKAQLARMAIAPAAAAEPIEAPAEPAARKAAVALAQLRDRRALAAVPHGLSGEDAEAALDALAILGWLSEPGDVAAAALADHADPRVAMTAEAVFLGP